MRSSLTAAATRIIPAPVKATLRRIRTAVVNMRGGEAAFARSRTPLVMDEGLYERLYEGHALQFPPDTSIGDGSYDQIGKIELAALRKAGLVSASTLVDLGCGTGRLSVHAVPFLAAGRYIGTDISESMLAHARARISSLGEMTCAVEFAKQRLDVFDLPDASADFICAFSVFTHMEHEDTYRYLRDALRVVRPRGRFVLSCLPVNLAVARDIFVASARAPFAERWKHVRNITTTCEFMEVVAKLAGWTVVEWYPGDVPTIAVPPDDALHALGQSILVLESPGAQSAPGLGASRLP